MTEATAGKTAAIASDPDPGAGVAQGRATPAAIPGNLTEAPGHPCPCP